MKKWNALPTAFASQGTISPSFCALSIKSIKKNKNFLSGLDFEKDFERGTEKARKIE